MARRTTSYALFHVEETARAARAVHARMMREGGGEFYVYFRPMRIEAIRDGEPTDGWTLAWPERVPGHLTVDELIAYFAARTARLPYLPD